MGNRVCTKATVPAVAQADLSECRIKHSGATGGAVTFCTNTLIVKSVHC